MNRAIQIRVNVVAHNEASFIEQCLDSIQVSLDYASQPLAEVAVIANGCSDATYAISSEYCRKREGWNAYNLDLGDKANAWNYAVNLTDDSFSLSIFIDGDCTISAQAIQALLTTYKNNPASYILAGVPGTKGNTTEQTITRTLNGQALSGNFYALTPLFVKKIKDNGFRLPVGLIGDDSLLAWVASHDFKLSHGITSGLLLGCKNADFYYHRLTPDSLNNIKLYIRRIYRYSLRHLQQCCIREYLELNDDFDTLPQHISELYCYKKSRHIRKKSVYGLFDLYNYTKIKG